MLRVRTLFAITAVAFIVLGLWTRYNPAGSIFTLLWGGTAYGLPLQIPCNGIAALFCFFAFLYSIPLVPWNSKATAWHFGLTLVTVALFSVGLYNLGAAADKGPGANFASLEKLLTFAYIIALPLFALVQSWFLLDFLRRIWLMRVRA